jgi:hypothetical protein
MSHVKFEIDIDGLDFGAAVAVMKTGRCITRAAWAESKKWLCLVGCEMTIDLPYQLRIRKADCYGDGELLQFFTAQHIRHIYIGSPAGQFEPWSAPHSDLLANDWQVVCIYGKGSLP